MPGPKESPSTHKGTLVPREQSPSPTRGPMHPAKEALSSSELKAVAIALLMLCSKSTVFPFCLFCLGSRNEYFFLSVASKLSLFHPTQSSPPGITKEILHSNSKEITEKDSYGLTMGMAFPISLLPRGWQVTATHMTSGRRAGE